MRSPVLPARFGKTALLLLGLGATVGTFFDWLHVVSGTVRYPDPGLWGQPLWVPVLFGSAGVALGLGRIAVGRALGDRARPISGATAAAALGAFFLSYLESAFLPDEVALGMLMLTAGAMFFWLDASPAGLLAALGAALVGPAVELTISRLGGFSYTDAEGPTFVLQIPLWLPLLYVAAATAVGAIARWHARGA